MPRVTKPEDAPAPAAQETPPTPPVAEIPPAAPVPQTKEDLEDEIARLRELLEAAKKKPAAPANETIAAARKAQSYKEALDEAVANTNFADPSQRAAFIAEFGTAALPPDNSCPPEGPEGDKTPAVLEWLADNNPAEFIKRYEGRGGELIQQLLTRCKTVCRTK